MFEQEIDRREAIRRLARGIVVPTVFLAGCDRENSAAQAGARRRAALGSLAPVHVDRDRIIDTVVCARPFRPSGFRLEAERIGDKFVVHNYGHGGGGFTLSWGCASLAADRIADILPESNLDVAVVGAGVIGLSTALVLADRGFGVTIYARDLPPNTTSNLAGASFYPSHVVEDGRLTAELRRKIGTACRISHSRFAELATRPRYGVTWRPQYFVTDQWTADIEAGPRIYRMLKDLYPNPELLGPREHPFRMQFAFREDNIFIEPSPYLHALVEDFRQAGGRIETREFQSFADVSSLEQELIFNCSGLGALSLVGDEELVPLPGQQIILAPQPEVDYAVVGLGNEYMFPRSDGVVLGIGEGLLNPDEMLDLHRPLLALRTE